MSAPVSLSEAGSECFTSGRGWRQSQSRLTWSMMWTPAGAVTFTSPPSASGSPLRIASSTSNSRSLR